MSTPSRQAGFTYLALLAVLVVLGWWLAGTGQLWSTVAQRQREDELLFIGEQFRQAISHYYEQSPGGARQYPPTLDALLQDPRVPFVRRYLRRIYADPFTGKAEWGLIRAPDEGIAGVYSLAPGKPLRRDNFSQQYSAFRQADSYADWKFVYQLASGDKAADASAPAATMPAPAANVAAGS